MAVVVQLSQYRKEEARSFGTIRTRKGTTKLYIRFPYHGKTVDKSTGLEDTPENRAQLSTLLDRFEAAIKTGTFRFAEAFPGACREEKEFFSRKEGGEYRVPPNDVLFGDYLDRWVAANLDSDSSTWRARDYRSSIAAHIRERFGRLTFGQITGVEVVAFVQGLRSQKLSPSRIRNILIPLRVVWEDAVEEHSWDLRDPFVHLKRRNRSGQLIPKRRKNPPEVFRFDEWMAMLNVVAPHYRPILELSVMTGMIASELSRLRASDDLGDRLRIPGEKTVYRERILPVPAPLRSVLGELKQRGGRFVRLHTGKPFEPSRFRKEVWVPAIETAGIPYRRPYATRHTFALWHLVTGTHPERLVSLMGHGSKQMVYEVYGKYTEGVEADAGKIRGYLGEGVAE